MPATRDEALTRGAPTGRATQRGWLPVVVGLACLIVVIGTQVLPPWQFTPRFPLPIAQPSLPAATPSVPRDGAMSSGPFRPPANATTGLVMLVLVGVVLGVLILAVLALVIFAVLRLRRPERVVAPLAATDAAAAVLTTTQVRSAVDRAREFLISDRVDGGAALAIVEAWAVLEDVASSLGRQRQPQQTPAEFTASLLARSIAASQDELAELLGLYEQARFGSESVVAQLGPADVERAEALLATLARRLDPEISVD